MTVQTRKLQPDQLNDLKQFPPRRLIFVILIMVLVISSIIIGVLSSWQHHNAGTIGISLFFALITCLLVFLQFYYPFYLPHTPPKALKGERAANKMTFRGILGIPPLTDPKIISQRQGIIDDLYAQLLTPDTSVMVLRGIGGVGKSTLAALIRERVEIQRDAPQSPFTAETIWLTIDEHSTVADLTGTLFRALKKPARNLHKMTSSEQAKALCKVLNSTKQSRLIIIDQFENLLLPQTEHTLVSPLGTYKLIEALNKQKSMNRVLLITRNWPQEYYQLQDHLCEYQVEGLTTNEGIRLLKQLGVQASYQDLCLLVERYEGHPLVLTLLSSLIQRYRLNLSDLFENPPYTDLLATAIARNLLDSIYRHQLSEIQQKLLFAFAIYRKPVPFAVVQETMKDVSLKDLQTALHGLLAQFLLQETERKHYRLHNIVAEYVKYYFLEKHLWGDERSLQMNYNLTFNFGFRQNISTIIEAGTSGSDLETFIEAIWHLCQAEQWRKAYELMEREKVNLLGWKRNILLELFQWLLPLDKWDAELSEAVSIYYYIGVLYADLGEKKEALKYYNRTLTILREGKYQNSQREGRTLNDLGRVYSSLGKKDLALRYLDEALLISREKKDSKWEVKALNNLALVHDDIGKRREALDFLKDALILSRRIADRWGEGRTLNNLGQIYTNQGDKNQAKYYYEQALSIREEKKDLYGESTTLRNLGLIHADIGKSDDALHYLNQALYIHRETADLWGEGRTLNNLGIIYADLGQKEDALEYLEKALSILQKVGDTWEVGKALRSLVRLYWIQGKKEDAQSYLEEALLLSRKVGDRKGEGRILTYKSKIFDDSHQREKTFKALEQALSILKEVGDPKGVAWTLHNLGLAYLNLQQQNEALTCFLKALHIRRNVIDRRGEGWTLYNIAKLNFSRENYNLALACFLSAGDIFHAFEALNSVETQNYIDVIRKEVGEEQFIQVKLYATQIIENELGRSGE